MSEIVRSGLESALARMPGLSHGIATHDGRIINPALAAHLGMEEGTL
jgi:alanine dehydrogenase